MSGPVQSNSAKKSGMPALKKSKIESPAARSDQAIRKWEGAPQGSRRNVREKHASTAGLGKVSQTLPQQKSPGATFAANLRQFESLNWESFCGFTLETMGVLLQLQNSLKQGDAGKAFNMAQEAKDHYQSACKDLTERKSTLSKPIHAAYVLLMVLTAARDAKTFSDALQACGLDRNDPRLENADPVVPKSQCEAKTQAGLPRVFDEGFPYVAGSVVQQYLNEKGPKGSKAIKLKKVIIDKDSGQITALEIFRKGSNTKTKTLDLQVASWKGTRLAAHLKKTTQDFAAFTQKLQAELNTAKNRWEKSMQPLPSFSQQKERELALTTLSKVMKALDRVDEVPSEFLRSKPQSVPRVTLHEKSSRDFYEKGDLSKLDTLSGQELRYFIDDLVSLSLESMFKNRQGRFEMKDVEVFATAFRTLGEPLENMIVKSKDQRIFSEMQPAAGAIEKFLADQDAQDFVDAIDQLFKKVAKKSTDAGYSKNLHRTFTLLPFILGGMTSDELAMRKIVELKPSASVTETELLRISVIYGDCSKACVDQFMQKPQRYLPRSIKK